MWEGQRISSAYCGQLRILEKLAPLHVWGKERHCFADKRKRVVTGCQALSVLTAPHPIPPTRRAGPPTHSGGCGPAQWCHQLVPSGFARARLGPRESPRFPPRHVPIVGAYLTRTNGVPRRKIQSKGFSLSLSLMVKEKRGLAPGLRDLLMYAQSPGSLWYPHHRAGRRGYDKGHALSAEDYQHRSFTANPHCPTEEAIFFKDENIATYATSHTHHWISLQTSKRSW